MVADALRVRWLHEEQEDEGAEEQESHHGVIQNRRNCRVLVSHVTLATAASMYSMGCYG